jgi:hypothetical protein
MGYNMEQCKGFQIGEYAVEKRKEGRLGER